MTNMFLMYEVSFCVAPRCVVGCLVSSDVSAFSLLKPINSSCSSFQDLKNQTEKTLANFFNFFFSFVDSREELSVYDILNTNDMTNMMPVKS